MPAPLPPPPKRILLIRLSAFGDVVIATGLLHALKRAYPQAEIDWLVQPEFAELLRTQATICNVIPWPRKDWRALLRTAHWWALFKAIRSFRARLRARDYDWVLDAQGLLKSRALAYLAGGRLRVGYASKEPGSIWMHTQVQRFSESHPQRRFIGDEHAPMLAALGIKQVPNPQLGLPPEPSVTPYLVAAPFTTRPQKHWPEAHWVTLLRQLVALDHKVQLMGGPGDAAAAERLVAAVASPNLENHVGATSFAEAARRIAGASQLVGVDTGLTHLGFALNRPTVALFGSTRPYSMARQDAGSVLFHPMPCAPCGRHPSCDGRFDCLKALTPVDVAANLHQIRRAAD